MARVTVEDCLSKVDNRFQLVLVASKRARQLTFSGEDPFVDWDNDKATVVALREIADGFVDKKILSLLEKEFVSGAVTDEDTLATIKKFYSKRDIILCPHSAIGVRVAQDFLDAEDTVISLGTAHPAKFKESVESALNRSIPIPSALKDVMQKEESVNVILPNKELVAEEIRKKAI